MQHIQPTCFPFLVFRVLYSSEYQDPPAWVEFISQFILATSRSMASAAAIRSKLKKILPGVDLNTTTERNIRQTLEQDFGCDVSAHAALIKVTVAHTHNLRLMLASMGCKVRHVHPAGLCRMG